METELKHHGILGMKWGVRRTPEQLGHRPSGGKRVVGSKDATSSKSRIHNDYKRARSKPLSQMSDDELRTALNRLNMERQYSMCNPSSVARGKQIALETMSVFNTVSTTFNNAANIVNTINKTRKTRKS